MDEGRNRAEEQERVEHNEMGRGKRAVETPRIKGKRKKRVRRERRVVGEGDVRREPH